MKKNDVERISLKELAALLNLSQSTVSRIMSGGPDAHRISKETRERVLRAAAKHHCFVNTLGKSLRKKVSYSIGVLVAEISEGYTTAVLGGVEDELLTNGYFYFVVSHRHREELLKAYPRMMLARSVDGMIAIDTLLEDRLPIPMVTVSGHKNPERSVRIEIDHREAARQGLTHLKELGHRRIAFIKGQKFSADTRQRWDAIGHVARALELTIDPRLVVQVQGDVANTAPGYMATRQLLERHLPFTAIFAFNDLCAIGAMEALSEAKLGIPEDVSVLGFDDVLAASISNPPLTTIRQPLRAMGRMAAGTLLQMIRNPETRPEAPVITVHPQLEVRGSTGLAKDLLAVEKGPEGR